MTFSTSTKTMRVVNLMINFKMNLTCFCPSVFHKEGMSANNAFFVNLTILES